MAVKAVQPDEFGEQPERIRALLDEILAGGTYRLPSVRAIMNGGDEEPVVHLALTNFVDGIADPSSEFRYPQKALEAARITLA